MWIPRLLTTNHTMKEYIDSFCKKLKISIEYIIKTRETTAEHYGILEKFPNFYKQAFICYNLCKRNNKLDDSNSAELFLVQPLWSNTSFKAKHYIF